MSESKNLMEGLLDEITRVTELITEYKSLPKGAGSFGATIMQVQVNKAKQFISMGDTIGMLQSYNELKECE